MLTNLNVIPFPSPDQVVITLSILNDLYMLFSDNATHADQMKNMIKKDECNSSVCSFLIHCILI